MRVIYEVGFCALDCLPYRNARRARFFVFCVTVCAILAFPALSLARPNQIAADGKPSPSPVASSPTETRPQAEASLQKAIFAAGCFWHVEDTFRHLPGVIDAISGFTGGTVKNPSYKQVCTGSTHHAEAVEVLYDPKKISYEQLLKAFWEMHDPTTMDRQGPDYGEQYRSAIFYLNDTQKKAALASRDKLAADKVYAGKIVTQIAPAGDFYKAEDYHQHYFEKHPNDPRACHR